MGDLCLLILRAGGFFFSGMSNKNHVQSYHLTRQLENSTDSRFHELNRVHAAPNRSQPQSFCREKQILGGSAAILHPIPFQNRSLNGPKITAHADCQRGFHLPERQRAAKFNQNFRIINHHKMPRLHVHGSRRSHGGFEQKLDLGFTDLFVSKFTDTAPAKNEIQRTHMTSHAHQQCSECERHLDHRQMTHPRQAYRPAVLGFFCRLKGYIHR